jgi:hypothetical protein
LKSFVEKQKVACKGPGNKGRGAGLIAANHSEQPFNPAQHDVGGAHRQVAQKIQKKSGGKI